jgi:hypothetical protein
VPVEGTALTISAGGIPFLSHAPKDIRRSLKSLACKYAAYSRHPERATVAQQRLESIQDAVSESIRDAIALAILNTVSSNEPLLQLVNGPQPVDRALLRQTVKDYSGINWSPGMAHLMAALADLWQADRARKPVQQVLLHLDALKDIVDLERFKAQIVEWLVTHFQRVLHVRGVRHEDWGDFVLQLHDNGFLEHAGPLYTWCVWCEETGIFGAIQTSYVGRDLFCWRCRRRVPFMAAFHSTGALDQALDLKDGVLAAALGWHLTMCGTSFEAGVELGKTELDFVVRTATGDGLIECKMNHLLGKDDALRKKLYDDRDQLRDHLRIAKGHGITLSHAACVVNLTRQHLASLSATMQPEADQEFSRVRGRILSYEDAAAWLRDIVAGTG